MAKTVASLVKSLLMRAKESWAAAGFGEYGAERSERLGLCSVAD
jgi:hypothetical protein